MMFENVPDIIRAYWILITKEDIFGEDLAKYTFTEQCEEVEGLHLDDGTTKIFLNMSSKNGPPELVSLLQYMKETSLDNPAVLVRDERMCRLDSIVNEVTESEEWENVSMSIYSNALQRGLEDGKIIGQEIGKEIGKKIGKEIGKEIGKKSFRIELVCKKLRKGKSWEEIADELEEDATLIRSICELASSFAPEYDSKMVIDAWMQANNL